MNPHEMITQEDYRQIIQEQLAELDREDREARAKRKKKNKIAAKQRRVNRGKK